MATKRSGVLCYDKAGIDEPIFVLRAQDRLAAEIVRQWAEAARRGGTKPEIVAEALQCADAMDAWPFHKHPGISIERHAPPTSSVSRSGMVYWISESHDFLSGKIQTKGGANMKLLAENDNRVDVRILSVSRDPKTQKMTYETFETISVIEATPEAVEKAVRTALANASK